MSTRISSFLNKSRKLSNNTVTSIVSVQPNQPNQNQKRLFSYSSSSKVPLTTKKGSLKKMESIGKQSTHGGGTTSENKIEDEIQILKPSGWKWVKGNLKKVLEYGHREGLLQSDSGNQGTQPSDVQGDDTDNLDKADKHDDDVVKIATHDLSIIHAAIPFLPVPVAAFCFILNVVAPGLGTALSGICAICMGQPRVNFKEGRRFMTLLVNILVGIAQLGTITFLLVGWFWSMAWGGLLLTHSLQYRQALIQHRQEAVATAAIEALTRDAILRRRDVRTLVQERRLDQANAEYNRRRSLFTRLGGKAAKRDGKMQNQPSDTIA